MTNASRISPPTSSEQTFHLQSRGQHLHGDGAQMAFSEITFSRKFECPQGKRFFCGAAIFRTELLAMRGKLGRYWDGGGKYPQRRPKRTSRNNHIRTTFPWSAYSFYLKTGKAGSPETTVNITLHGPSYARR
jgi:hypothetical protein